jgi:hypothetical protein
MSETQLEVNGVTYSSNGFELISLGMSLREKSIIELLEEHVWQLDVAPNGKWKQRCRCGFYGVFNDHLIALIKGGKK